jgi:peptidoglycan-associated lipoprotein
MNHFQSFVLAASVTVLLAACSSTPVAKMESVSPPPVIASQTQTPAPVPVAKSEPVAASTVASVVVPPYLDPGNALSKDRSFYFDYDNYSVKPDYSRQLELHGKFLASSLKVSIRVEGNTDERGSSEYNLALGQKRAAAVVEALKVYGATDAQMEAVSWGREKPKAEGHDEAAWAQNRRVDLAYPAK